MKPFNAGQVWRRRDGGRARIQLKLGFACFPWVCVAAIDGMQTTCTEDGRVLEDQESPHDLVALLVEEDGTTVPETDPAEDRAKELEDLIRTITVDLLSLKNQEKYDPRGSSNAERGIQDVLNRIKKVIP